MSKAKKSSGKGAAVFLILWILLAVAGGVVAAEYFELIHIRDTLRPYYEMFVSDPEGFKAYVETAILPKLTEAATIVGAVLITLSPVIAKVKQAATMFDGGTRAAVVSMETAEASRAENLAFQAEVRDEIRAALERMESRMDESLAEQARIINAYDERAERTEEKVDRLTEMEITAIGGSSELVRKNVAAKAILVGRTDVPTERRAKEARRASAASAKTGTGNARKGGAADGKSV